MLFQKRQSKKAKLLSLLLNGISFREDLLIKLSFAFFVCCCCCFTMWFTYLCFQTLLSMKYRRFSCVYHNWDIRDWTYTRWKKGFSLVAHSKCYNSGNEDTPKLRKREGDDQRSHNRNKNLHIFQFRLSRCLLHFQNWDIFFYFMLPSSFKPRCLNCDL